MDPTYPLVPIANAIGCALTIIPLFHMNTRTWNTGVYVFVLWLSLSCFQTAINTVVWAKDVEDRAPLWCDISIRLQILAEYGIPACSLIITRRLCKITRFEAPVAIKRHEKHTELLIESTVCLGIPTVIAVLFYVVQSTRYAVIEELGCAPAEQFSGLSILLVDAWSILLPMMSLIFYSPRIIYTFYCHRKEMREFLNSTNDGPSQNYCYRMIALGCFDILTMLPIGALQIANSIVSIVSNDRFQFYQGWTIVHSKMDPRLVPKSEWSTDKWNALQVQWNQWVYPFLALAFFGLFGLTSSAMSGYRKFFHIFARKLYTKQDVSVQEEVAEAAFRDGRGTNATILLITSGSSQADSLA